MAIVFTKEQAADYLRQQSGYKNDIQSISEQASLGTKLLETQFQGGIAELGKAYGAESYNLGKDFTQSMSQAFDSAKQSRGALLTQSPNIGVGQRGMMVVDLEQATQNAYDSYINNFIQNKQNLEGDLRSGVASLENTKAAGLQTLSENAYSTQAALEREIESNAANYAALANTPIEYLQHLWETNPDAFNDGVLLKYTYVDEDGQRQLIDPAQLRSDFFQQSGDKGMSLSEAGKEFYSTIAYGLNGVESLDEYLKDTNESLYNWAILSNAYGDSEFVNAQGYSTNFDAVMGSLVGADVVKAGTYDTTNSIYRNSYTGGEIQVYENSKDFGTVRQAVSSSGVTISSLDGLQYDAKSGAAGKINWDDIKDYKGNEAQKSESFKVTYTDGAGNERVYNLKVLKDEADGKVFSEISNTFGKIEDKKLYDYGGEVYMGLVLDDGSIKLRKVKIGASSKDAWNTLSNPGELKKTNIGSSKIYAPNVSGMSNEEAAAIGKIHGTSNG